TGKSALADALGREMRAPVLSVDPIEAAIMRSGIPQSFETGLAAYEVVAVLAAHQLGLGLPVIVDALSSLEVARELWRQAAARTDTGVRVLEVVCGDESTHRARLAARQRGLVGFQEPTWDDIVARRDEWEPWAEERLVVDSMRDLRDNLAAALAFVEG